MFRIFNMYTLTLDGNSSELSCDIFPPIEITRGSQLCLLSLRTNNSIPNIEPRCSTIGFCNGLGERYTVSLPMGTYELKNLESCIIKKIPETVAFELKADENTLKCQMKCDDEIDFTVQNSISRLLGFENLKYKAGTVHESRNIVNIMRVNSIKVECNLIFGSFCNGVPDQTIHEFSPAVPPGYKIIEVPLHTVYYPLVHSSVSKVNVTLRDQDNNLINLRGEPITIRLQIIRGYGSQV